MTDAMRYVWGQNWTLFAGVRDGYLLCCNRCKSMNYFPWLLGPANRFDSWCKIHDLWCPAVLDAALLQLHSRSVECRDTAAAAAPEE